MGTRNTLTETFPVPSGDIFELCPSAVQIEFIVHQLSNAQDLIDIASKQLPYTAEALVHRC